MAAEGTGHGSYSPEISVTDAHADMYDTATTMSQPMEQSQTNLSVPSIQRAQRLSANRQRPKPIVHAQSNDQRPSSQSSEDNRRSQKREGSQDRSQPAASDRSSSRPPSAKRPTPSRLTPKHYHGRKAGNAQVEWPNQANFENGRVLIIDYIRRADVKAGKTVIAHREFAKLPVLEKFYSNQKCLHEAALRVIHVQNAPWATPFLLWKYNISPKDDLTGTNFSKWAVHGFPELRAGKPWLKGRTWRAQRDPWRGIRRIEFCLDYYKQYYTDNVDVDPIQDHTLRVMEFANFDEDGQLSSGINVYGQRISVYVQHLDPELETPPDDVKNPYGSEYQGGKFVNGHGGVDGYQNPGKKPGWYGPVRLEDLDNGSTIIIWEQSVTGSNKDTLLTARDQIESRWRRLSFFLPREDIRNDENLTLHGINYIISDIFRAMSYHWEEFLGTAETHVSILEDKIYDSPADETRAPELWSNSSNWLKAEKVCNNHIEVVKELRSRLNELTESESSVSNWLDGINDEFDKTANLIQEDLVKPTANLNDLLYKSVGIRDSRHSLQLNTSLWRLSWITFIFLPLTFTVGFFGMNVGLFHLDPSIKWYFVAAVVLMMIVIILWYLFKHLLQSRRYTPYQRGIYEHLYHDLSTTRPDLWTRRGPRRHIKPIGTYNQLKWRLARYWFRPDKTIAQPEIDPDEDAGGSGLGAWARIKRRLVRRWLTNLKVEQPTSSELEDLTVSEQVEEVGGAVKMAANVAAATATADAMPVDPNSTSNPLTKYYSKMRPNSPPAVAGTGSSISHPSVGNTVSIVRPGSSGSSSDGMIIEERDDDEKEEEDKPWTRDWRKNVDSIIGGLYERN